MVGRRNLLPLIAGVAVVVLTLELGNWQVRRAGEKAALQASFEMAGSSQVLDSHTAPGEWHQVNVRGRWLAQSTILIDNRVYQGRAGYHVITPFQIDGEGRVIAVNRGWVPAGATRDILPEIRTPDDIVSVSGRVRLAEADPFRLGQSNEAGVVWQSIDLPRLRANVPALADYYLQQTSAGEDGLVRDWPAPDAGIDRHHGYALQWYALAALAGGLTAWYAFNEIRRAKRDKRSID